MLLESITRSGKSSSILTRPTWSNLLIHKTCYLPIHPSGEHPADRWHRRGSCVRSQVLGGRLTLSFPQRQRRIYFLISQLRLELSLHLGLRDASRSSPWRGNQ